MKSTLRIPLFIGLLILLTLTGCTRSRLRLQETQPVGTVKNPPAATLPDAVRQAAPSQPPSTTLSLPQSAPQSTSQDSQPVIGTLSPAETQPVVVQPTSPASELLPAADDLLKSLDGLSQDLGSTDTLDDLK